MSLAAAYTKTASYFHWIVAVPLVGAVGTVLKAQSLPKEAKEEKMKLMFTHKSLGLLTGILVAPRLVYRIINMGKFSTVEKLPGTGPVLSALSNFNHLGLYLFMIGMPASGIAMGMYSGKGLPFFWTTLPGFEKPNGKLAGQNYDIHKTLGYYGKFLIPVHVGAAFGHAATGSKIFSRINPFRSGPVH